MNKEFQPYIKPSILRTVVVLMIFGAISFSIWKGQDNPSLAWQVFCAGIISATVAATWNIYDINSWPLWKRSFLHTIIMGIVVLPTIFVSGWFPIRGIGDVLIGFASFVGFGIIFWTVGYFAFRNK